MNKRTYMTEGVQVWARMIFGSNFEQTGGRYWGSERQWHSSAQVREKVKGGHQVGMTPNDTALGVNRNIQHYSQGCNMKHKCKHFSNLETSSYSWSVTAHEYCSWLPIRYTHYCLRMFFISVKFAHYSLNIHLRPCMLAMFQNIQWNVRKCRVCPKIHSFKLEIGSEQWQPTWMPTASNEC